MKHNLSHLNRIKYLSILVVVAAIVGLVWFLNRSFVTIAVSPAAAKLTIDNAPILINRDGVGKTTVSPGTHTVKVEAENFLPISKEVNFRKGKKTTLNYVLKQKPEISTIESGARFLAPGKESNEVFYLDSSGMTLFRANLIAGSYKKIVAEKNPITSARLSGINEIIWSPNKDLALFKKNDGVYLFDFQKYDFVHQTEILWGKDIGDIAWAPDNSKIAYYSIADKALIFANIADTEKNRIAVLTDYNIPDPLLAWSPDSQYLILIPRSKSYDQNKIYLYNVYAGTFTALTDLGNQIGALFSPDSASIIYTTYSAGSGDTEPYIVSIMNKDGSNQKSLDLRSSIENITFVDKNTISAAEYSRASGAETFLTRNIVSNDEPDTVQSVQSKIVNDVTIANEGKIAIYETADGVFAFSLK